MRPLPHNRHMPDFHARAAGATENFPLVDRAAANPRAGKNPDNAASVARGSEAKFAVDPGIDVVQNDRGTPERIFEFRADLGILPTEVGHFQNNSAIEIKGSGTPNANARQIVRGQPSFFQGGFDQTDHAMKTAFRALLRAGLAAFAAQNVEVVIENDRQHLRPAKVESNPMLSCLLGGHSDHLPTP